MANDYDWRGVLRAYISQEGARHQPDVGSTTFQEMFVRAPKGARFAVAEDEHSRFLVFDLWKGRELREEGKPVFIRPKEYKVYHDLDHAIGTTVMKYGDTSLLSKWITPTFGKFFLNIWKEWRDK